MTAPTSVAHPDVPQRVRTELVHAYAQMVADLAGVDILHIKGAAVDPVLQQDRRTSLDVDVLVRPAHVPLMVAALREQGWSKMTGFDEGSAFGHAMNLRHDLGLIDLHRSWPGFDISPDEAFTKLWESHQEAELGGILCPTPSLAHQRLILLLHYGRSGGQRQEDQRVGWIDASLKERLETQSLVHQFRAEVAFAAATGHLEEFRDDPDYRLWRYFATGQGSRLEEWSGRWQAARTASERFRVLHGFFVVNHDLLALELGHPPTRAQTVRAQFERMVIAGRDVRTMALQAWQKHRGH